jgi:crotonobetainyl-CoA:carnitine CoA-transferase CaiB-like acyl-CoA transferase
MNAPANRDQPAGGQRRPLGAYRVIELPGAPTAPFGKTFSSLGADVIKVEPPGGDPARGLPPLMDDGGEWGNSLYWAAYGAGKRGVTADIDTAEGRDLVRRLAATADIVVESYAPGALAARGLSFETLRQANRGLILTSITPFGQTGPYAGRHGSDLVHLAMGGYLNLTGPSDGTPLKPSAPYQSWLHACGQAVAATLLALRQRRRTGRGTHVDQAMRDTGMWMLTHTYQFYDLLGINLKRQGALRDMGGGAVRLGNIWRCKDGLVVWLFQAGHVGGARIRALVAWMAEHGMAPKWLEETNWEDLNLLSTPVETIAAMGEAFAAFLLTKTKQELFTWALASGMMLAPMQTLRDVAADRQLEARGVWRNLDLGHGRAARVPGPPVRFTDAAWEPCGDLPAAGAHNRAVYGEELGVPAERLDALAAAGVI